MNPETLSHLFDHPKLVGMVADANSGKSNMLYYMLNTLRNKYQFRLYTYGLRVDIGEQKIYSVEELEIIHDSIIIIDEFASMMQNI